MRLRQIEVFHAIYTNGSISAAARALHVSQPAVSKVLHHTQAQLGFELFTLVRGRLVATDEAHALFAEVKEIFQRLGSLQSTAANLRHQGGGHLRIAVVPSLGLDIAPRAITEYRRAHPQVTFDVQTLHHGDLLQALQERECDVAFAYDPPAHPRLHRRILGGAQLMVLFHPDDLPDAAAAVPITALDGRDVVGMTSSGPVGDLLATALEHHGVGIREVVSNQTYYLAAALARCGAGITVVDEFSARLTARTDPQLKYRPLEPAIEFNVCCVHLDDRPPSRLAEGFIDQFASALGQTAGE